MKVARDQHRLNIVVKDRSDAQHINEEGELHISQWEYAGVRTRTHKHTLLPAVSMQSAEHGKQRACVLHAWHITRQCTFDVQRFVEKLNEIVCCRV
jgi:hypothetical protein